jgi:protein phosphatase
LKERELDCIFYTLDIMGQGFFFPVLVQLQDRVGSDLFRVGSCTVNGHRENQEDAHSIVCRPDGGFFGVFDGHGGPECSKYIAADFGKAIQDGCSLKEYDLEKLKSLALAIDRQFIDPLLFKPWDGYAGGVPTSGSTGTFFIARPAAAAVPVPEGPGGDTAATESRTPQAELLIELLVGNVGDSRVLVWTGVELIVMTKDHKPDDPEEKERIERCGGRVERGRVDGSLALSRAFGDRLFKENKDSADPTEQKVIALPDMSTVTVPWGKGAFAALCCDGVYERNFSNEQIVDFIREKLSLSKDLAAVAGMVCCEAVRRGSRDNVTCMLVEFADGTDLPRDRQVTAATAPFTDMYDNKYRRRWQECAVEGGTTIEALVEQRQRMLHIRSLRQKEQQEALATAVEAAAAEGKEPPSSEGLPTSPFLTQLELTELDNYRQNDTGAFPPPPPDNYASVDSPPGPVRLKWFAEFVEDLATCQRGGDWRERQALREKNIAEGRHPDAPPVQGARWEPLVASMLAQYGDRLSELKIREEVEMCQGKESDVHIFLARRIAQKQAAEGSV